MLSKFGATIFKELKNFYNRFLEKYSKHEEYYLKLEGYYFCKRKRCTIVIINVRNKRIVEKLPVSQIVVDKKFIAELHPADACIIGILANNERNGAMGISHYNCNKIKRSQYSRCFLKTGTILKISKKYFNKDGNELTVLFSPSLNQEIEIPTIDLSKNEALLYAIDPIQAVSIGYDASESFLRKH